MKDRPSWCCAICCERVDGDLDQCPRCYKPCACAAGPWRTDVANAPKDGRKILGTFDSAFGEYVMRGWWEPEFKYWKTDTGYCFIASKLIAFADYNPYKDTES